MSDQKIEKIEKIGSSLEPTETKEIEQTQRVVPNQERFNNFLHEEKAQTAIKDPTKTSLMDTVRDYHYSTSTRSGTASLATTDALISQTKQAIAQIDEVKKVLEQPNVKIKTSAQQLLRNKLSHIDESLQIALSKAGVEYVTPIEENLHPNRVNPVERFIGFLTDGQTQLQRLGDELNVMGKLGKDMSPVNMLAIQVKVAQIQQELELFSSLLNKALESIKTVMNIQV